MLIRAYIKKPSLKIPNNNPNREKRSGDKGGRLWEGKGIKESRHVTHVYLLPLTNVNLRHSKQVVIK